MTCIPIQSIRELQAYKELVEIGVVETTTARILSNGNICFEDSDACPQYSRSINDTQYNVYSNGYIRRGWNHRQQGILRKSDKLVTLNDWNESLCYLKKRVLMYREFCKKQRSKQPLYFYC